MADGPAELVEKAVCSVLCGGTFPALARQVAWHAARQAGASDACLEWLTALALPPLARGVEALEFAVERASVAARAAHLASWPYDATGADLAARLAGEEEARDKLERLEAEVREWATEILEQRLRAEAA